MSANPICAGYKFPASSPECPDRGFDFGKPSAPAGFATSRPSSHNEADDYFTLKAPPTSSQRPIFLSPKKSAGRNNASGSVSSLGSESTFVEAAQPYMCHDFNMSTDTLFEDCEASPSTITDPASKQTSDSASVAPKGQRNVLQLSLNVPKRGLHHKARSSLGYGSASTTRQSVSEETTCMSALEARFQLDRKYSLGVGEELHSRERQGSTLTSVPSLKKHLTLPILTPTSSGSFLDSIKTQQIKKLSFVQPQENLRDSILGLSPSISYLAPEEVVSVIHNSSILPETGLRNILVLDIRPLADHVKAHVAGSINICLPSTLLKRPSFDFKRCVNSLPNYEKMILQNYFYHNNLNFENAVASSNPHAGAHGFPAIILYDNTNNSSGIYHMCRKLVDHSCFDTTSAPPIYLIDAPFSDFTAAHGDVLETGKVESVDLSTLSLNDSAREALPVSGQPIESKVAPGKLNLMNPLAACVSTPNVSNFSLPQNLPETKFKIRHNEERFDFTTKPSTDDRLSSLSVSSPGLQLLPQWLKSSVANNTQIRADFNRLEECEKSRLNSALKIKMEREFMTPGGNPEATPVINSGLDYGHKNRYKDIFLYEHSRVSLNDSSEENSRLVPGPGSVQMGCDYINASYLRSSSSVMGKIMGIEEVDEHLLREGNCIATQGPLLKTAGDFWKLVAHQRSLVIISLTNDYENGVEKCFAFWKSGRYMSGSSVVDVSLVESEDYGALTLRTFAINIDNKVHHKVMQLHLHSWVDMGVAIDSDEVLAMIHLKHDILANAADIPEFPTIIHCSAGCGRTGVFAAADMLMNAYRAGGDAVDTTFDPVYGVVNDLRRQRISMVQTIRQYSSIYGLLIQSIVGSGEYKSISNTNIAKSFAQAH